MKIGTIKRLDDVFFKLLFADGMGISVSCILDFEITEQNGYEIGYLVVNMK
ncbi:MAG: hypothetical protein OSJ43_15390 [Oscillospiraceae bacterium]|nr:hypothetical protein [Oscillospiraceae bacterium]